MTHKYLKYGIMQGDIEHKRERPPLQYSPLSPLLSNTLLNELNKKQTNRGYRFIKYVDDYSHINYFFKEYINSLIVRL